MGKITVNHFLNKKVKPQNKSGEDYYPVYLQIIYNKLANEKRSETGIFMNDSTFESYAGKKEIRDSGLIKTKSWYGIDGLSQEIKHTTDSLKAVEKYQIKITRSTIFQVVGELSRPTGDFMTEILREKIQSEIWDKTIFKGLVNEQSKQTQYEDLLLCFSGNIIDSIEKIEKYTGLNITNFIKTNDLIRLKAIQEIKNIAHDNYTHFSEFIISDYQTDLKNRMKKQTLEQYGILIEQVEYWIKEGIEHVRTLYGKI